MLQELLEDFNGSVSSLRGLHQELAETKAQNKTLLTQIQVGFPRNMVGKVLKVLMLIYTRWSRKNDTIILLQLFNKYES